MRNIFRRCNHDWKVHADVKKTYTGTGTLNKGQKIVEREQTLICKKCGKIKQIIL